MQRVCLTPQDVANKAVTISSSMMSANPLFFWEVFIGVRFDGC